MILKTSWSFDTTTTSLTTDKSDFLSTALHELEHVLGFESGNPAFHRFETSSGFVGPASEAANGGKPVPLNSDFSHWAPTTTYQGVAAEMAPSILAGTRRFTSPLDFAALTDMGWQVGTQDSTITTAPQKFTELPSVPGAATVDTTTFSGSISTANHVDVSRIYISAGSSFQITVRPSLGLNSSLRLFDMNGTQLAFADSSGNGVVDTLTFTASRTDYYYVGISSYGNRGYNPNVANSGAGGETGTYSTTIAAVNRPPQLTGASTLTYTEGQAASAINLAIQVSDPDNTTLASGVVKITNFVAGQDVLGFVAVPSTMGNIIATVNNTSGVVTLTSAGHTATLAQWQAALHAITYRNSSQNPSITTRSVTFQVDDGQIANDASNVITSTIIVKAVNNSPVLVGSSQLNYTESQTASAINLAIQVSDPDNTTLASGVVKITNFVAGQDALGFVAVPSTMGNIIATLNNTSGVVTLTSAGHSATLAQWQAALHAITYRNSSQNPSITTRSVTFQVDDGQTVNHASNMVPSTIAVRAINNPPFLAGSNQITYTKNQAAIAIDPLITVSDPDNTTLASGVVKITNFVVGQDLLGFAAMPSTMGNIVGTVNNATGIITLTSARSTATLAQWQTALRAITYRNSSQTPTTTARTVTFQVDDGQSLNHASNALTSMIVIKSV